MKGGREYEKGGGGLCNFARARVRPPIPPRWHSEAVGHNARLQSNWNKWQRIFGMVRQEMSMRSHPSQSRMTEWRSRATKVVEDSLAKSAMPSATTSLWVPTHFRQAATHPAFEELAAKARPSHAGDALVQCLVIGFQDWVMTIIVIWMTIMITIRMIMKRLLGIID